MAHSKSSIRPRETSMHSATMWEDSLNMGRKGLKVDVVRAQSTPVEGLPSRSSRVVIGFDCSTPTTPSQPSTPRQRLPRSPLSNLLKEQDLLLRRSLSINVGGSRLSPAIGSVLGTQRKARSLADLRGCPSDTAGASTCSPGSSLSRPSTPIPIPDCREILLRPEAALLEDLSMEDASGHLPPSVDLPMHRAKSGRCGSGAFDKCEASGDVPFVVLHPENAVKQLRCLEERLRQTQEQEVTCRMVMELRIREEERARLHMECNDMRARSMALDECAEMVFDLDEAPATPPACAAPVSQSAGKSSYGIPPRPPLRCNLGRRFSAPHAMAAW